MAPTDPATEYFRTRSTDDGQGFKYEQKMTLLAALRLYRDYDEFHLANNLAKGDKFDDIVYSCTYKGYTETWFIQLKHKQIATLETKKISLSALRTKDDFNLDKYFHSFKDVVRKFRPGSRDAIFGNDPATARFAIFTNALLHPLMAENVMKTEVLLSTKSPKEANFIFTKEDLENKSIFAGKPSLNDSLINLFSSRFILCTGQRNEPDMNALIQNEVEEICKDLGKSDVKYVTHQLYDFIDIWLKKGEFLTKEKMKEVLSSASVETQVGRKNQSTLEFTKPFTKFVINSLNSTLTSLISKADSTQMCMTLLKQEGFLDEPNKLVALSQLEKPEIQNHLITEWAQKNVIFVVDCEGDIMNVNKKIVSNFLTSLTPNLNNKVILVYTMGNEIAVEIAALAKVRNIRFNCTMANLVPHSVKMLRECKVDFQGYTTSLASLMPNSKRLDDVFDLASMTQLLQGRVVKVGLNPISNIPYYVTRVLTRQSIVEPFFTDAPAKFALSGISFENAIMQFSSENVIQQENTVELSTIQQKIIIMDENPEEEFLKLSEKIDGPLHWFELKRGAKKNWIWRKSKVMEGYDMTLISERATGELEYVSTENVMDIKDKVVVITAEPGMGKSTLLSHLAAETKKLRPDVWVICLALNDYTEQFDEPNFLLKIDEKSRNLVAIAAGVDKETSKFDLRLFNQCYDITGNMIVLLDGFDEITPYYTEHGMALIDSLRRSQVSRVWVTARPQWRNLLESRTCTLGYTIKAFTNKDQTNFLCKYWKHELPNIDEIKLKECVTKILELIDKCFDEKLHQFTGIPLQTRMVAEVFLDSVRSYHTTEILELKERLNGVELFQEFVAKKRGIQQEKAKITVTNASAKWEQRKLNEQRESELMSLALLALLQRKVCRSLDPPVSESLAKELKRMVAQGHEKSGIVLSFQGDQPQFIHRTFAEYFAALFFTRHFSTNKDFLASNEFFEASFSFVKYFFDRILCQGCKFHEAILDGELENLQLMVAAGIDVNCKDAGGRTALHIAAFVPDSENIIIYLLENGADPDAVDSVLGWQPIQYACQLKATENIAPLLEKASGSLDPGVVPMTWQSLQKAVFGDYLKLFLHLMENGMYEVESLDDLSAQMWYDDFAREGLTILHLAAALNACQILEYLLRKNTRDSKARLIECLDAAGNTPLLIAGARGCLDAIRILLKAGANTLAKTADGKNLIQFAVEMQSIDILSLCVKDASQRKASVESFLPMAVTTLVTEKSSEKTEWAAKTLQLLFTLYPNLIELKTPRGLPLMAAAISRGNVLLVNCLISMGADANVTVSDKPALHYAVKHGNEDMVKALLNCKTLDIHARDDDGHSAVDVAIMEGHTEVFQLLIAAGASVGDVRDQNVLASILHKAIGSGDEAMLKTILNSTGIDVNVVDLEGHLPLYKAILLDNAEIIEALIDAGAVIGDDVNASTPEGPLLHVAATKGQEHIVASLISNSKLDINGRDDAGYTALHKAVLKGHVDIVQLLCDAGADIRCTANDGSDLTHAVAATATPEIFYFLLESGLNFSTLNQAGQSGLSLLKEAGAFDLVQVLDPSFKTEMAVRNISVAPVQGQQATKSKKKKKSSVAAPGQVPPSLAQKNPIGDNQSQQQPTISKKAAKKAKQPPPPPKKTTLVVHNSKPAEPVASEIDSHIDALPLPENIKKKLKTQYSELARMSAETGPAKPKKKKNKSGNTANPALNASTSAKAGLRPATTGNNSVTQSVKIKNSAGNKKENPSVKAGNAPGSQPMKNKIPQVQNPPRIRKSPEGSLQNLPKGGPTIKQDQNQPKPVGPPPRDNASQQGSKPPKQLAPAQGGNAQHPIPKQQKPAAPGNVVKKQKPKPPKPASVA